jgi:hypothetical protein
MRQLTLLKFTKAQILIQYIRVLVKDLSIKQVVELPLDKKFNFTNNNVGTYYYVKHLINYGDICFFLGMDIYTNKLTIVMYVNNYNPAQKIKRKSKHKSKQ